MTNVTLTTEQAQQIEEALEDIVRVFKFETGTPVEALAVIRAARAQGQAEQEPFDMDDHPPHRLCECRKCLEYFTDKAHKEALEHITDGSPCWCNPEMTYKDPSNGAEVWVHKEL